MGHTLGTRSAVSNIFIDIRACLSLESDPGVLAPSVCSVCVCVCVLRALVRSACPECMSRVRADFAKVASPQSPRRVATCGLFAWLLTNIGLVGSTLRIARRSGQKQHARIRDALGLPEWSCAHLPRPTTSPCRHGPLPCRRRHLARPAAACPWSARRPEAPRREAEAACAPERARAPARESGAVSRAELAEFRDQLTGVLLARAHAGGGTRGP